MCKDIDYRLNAVATFCEDELERKGFDSVCWLIGFFALTTFNEDLSETSLCLSEQMF